MEISTGRFAPLLREFRIWINAISGLLETSANFLGSMKSFANFLDHSENFSHFWKYHPLFCLLKITANLGIKQLLCCCFLIVNIKLTPIHDLSVGGWILRDSITAGGIFGFEQALSLAGIYMSTPRQNIQVS